MQIERRPLSSIKRRLLTQIESLREFRQEYLPGLSSSFWSDSLS